MKKRIFIISGGILFLIFLDQLSKYLAQKYLTSAYSIILGFFELEYSQNTGIAFGIGIPYVILIILSFILIAAVIYVFIREFKIEGKISQVALMLVMGGALGNLIDRFLRGYVIDFIAIWKWPNFNLADMYISIGILLMIVFYGKMTRSERNRHAAKRSV